MPLLSDDELFHMVDELGQSLADLFLVGEDIYSNKGVQGWGFCEDYKQILLGRPDRKMQLVGFLKRLSAERFPSIEAFADHLARGREWQTLYRQLSDILSRHGVEDPFGNGDYFLIDDDCGSLQHKVECKAEFIRPELVMEVQRVLGQYSRKWEVIFANLQSGSGQPSALRVFRDRSEHAS